MSENKRLTIKDLYNNDNASVSYELYKKVLYTFHELLSDYVIETGKEVKLPKRLGTLQVKKRLTNASKKVDFHLTKQYGETIYHTNKHSEGYYGIFIWNKDKPQACFTNKQLYKLEMTRANKRNLSYAIKYKNAITQYIEHN